VARIVAAALAEPAPPPEAMFDHIYGTPSLVLEAQRRELRAHLQASGHEEEPHA
jgi:hypothetical protein